MNKASKHPMAKERANEQRQQTSHGQGKCKLTKTANIPWPVKGKMNKDGKQTMTRDKDVNIPWARKNKQRRQTSTLLINASFIIVSRKAHLYQSSRPLIQDDRKPEFPEENPNDLKTECGERSYRRLVIAFY